MKRIVLVLSSLFVLQPVSSFAEEAPAFTGHWLRCDSNHEPTDHAMVVYGENSAIVVRNGERIFMTCEKGQPPEPPEPDGEFNLYSCVEERAGDGRLGLTVTRGGISPSTLGRLTIEQPSPLPPVFVDSYLCQDDRPSP